LAHLVCLTLGAAVPAATAQGRIEVPKGCGGNEEFDSEIERLTGAPAALAAPASVSIEPHAEGGFELRLTLADEQRTLRDPECRVLWRSALVIVAAASKTPVEAEPPSAPPGPVPALPRVVEPTNGPPASVATSPLEPPRAAFETSPPLGAASAGAPSDAAAPRRTAPRARRARGVPSARARDRVPTSASAASESDTLDGAAPAAASAGAHWGVAAGVGVSSGVVPGLGPSFELSAQREVLPWAAALSVRYWPERSEVVGERGVDISAIGVRAAALFRVVPALNVLAGLELMRLVGAGAPGVSARNEDAAWQLAPTLGVSVMMWDIGHLRLELGVAGRVSLLRPQFVVTGFGELYRAPPLGGDAIIRGVWLFP
jgi:hypothetical protein